MNDEQIRSIFDQMCIAGWLSGYHYEDGTRFRLDWTPEGGDQAAHIIGLARLNDVNLSSDQDFHPLPDVLAKTLIWKLAVSKIQKDGQALSRDEESILFDVLVRWKG